MSERRQNVERRLSDFQILLGASRLFEGASEPAIADGASLFVPIHSAGRSTIYDQGDRCERIYILLRGLVRIGQLSEDGRDCTVRVVGPGELFGYEALFGETVSPAAATALEPCTLAAGRAGPVESFLLRRPQLALNFARCLREQYECALGQAPAAAASRVGERLLSLLHDLAAKYGVRETNGTRIETPLTQQQIASLIGSTRETVSCELGKLARRGQITRSGRSIVLTSLQACVA